MATRYGLPIADSALQLISWGVRRDGVYLLNLPTVGRTKVFCLLDKKWDGGGWMMMMKATAGTTFGYDASYWTTNNTLNPNEVNQNDGDAKFNVMNYYQGKDFLARWPDITIGTGGSITGLGSWIWLQNNYNDGTRIIPISFFNISYPTMNAGGAGKFIQDAKTYNGWSTDVFSSQPDIRFYGFNYVNNPEYFGRDAARVRWGFGWNENGEGLYPSDYVDYIGSNDVSAGIGMDYDFGGYSAGDRINCCEDNAGINRSARVEVYVR
jgi:hypothetical protein